MARTIPRVLTIVLLATSGAVSAFFLSQILKLAGEVSVAAAEMAHDSNAHGASEGHGAAAAHAPAGDHAPASEHGAASAHGAPAGEHGGGHGAAAAASAGAPTLVSLDEIFANVPGRDQVSHTLGIKIDLELFEDESRRLIDTGQAVVKDAVISTTVEQDYDNLNTVAGKLFYKEAIVARINKFFNQAVIRDIHFSSFYLQ